MILFVVSLVSIVFIAITGYILWWVVPKGTMLYEALDLIPLWSNQFTRRTLPMWEKKYTYGKHWRQYVLLNKPLNGEITKDHIIVYFHGGAWRVGKPELFRLNAQLFVNQGYMVIMPSHRRVPFYGYKHLREDLDGILAVIQKIYKEHHLEGKKIILGGISSGANLAALMLYNRESLKKLNFPRHLFAGIFLFAAPLDLKQMRDTRFLRFYCGNPQSEKAQLASPISYLQSDECLPVLCVHGTLDGLVPFGNSLSFVKRYREIAPEKIDFKILRNATHLDASRWSYQDDEVRKTLMNWLAKVEDENSSKDE